jgi:hypothetical protein
MSNLLPFDLTEVLYKELTKRREPSGKLRCSSELLGPLRHAQLRLAGAPTIESELVSEIRLKTGTMWHEFFNDVLCKNGLTFMQEINVTPWLPEGWGGVADWLFWHEQHRAFALADLKSIKGEGIKWIKDGVKDDHLWQLSSYYHALVDARFPMIEGFSVFYLPMNDTTDRREQVEPVVADCVPLPRDEVFGLMEERWACTSAYLDSLPDPKIYDRRNALINELLAPPMERVQKCTWDKTKSVWNVSFVPHWSTNYCPYPDELCDCSTQGVTKIGEHTVVDGELRYTPRKGYEDQTPTVRPDEREVKRRG